jgi:hypothetical protein
LNNKYATIPTIISKFWMLAFGLKQKFQIATKSPCLQQLQHGRIRPAADLPKQPTMNHIARPEPAG